MKVLLLSAIMIGCATTQPAVTKSVAAEPVDTLAFDCIGEDPHKEGACSIRAAFIYPIDCVSFISIARPKTGGYVLCSVPSEEKQ